MVSNLSEGLIVSCQALANEPLFGSRIMAKMAIAALKGGAVAIRANTKKDINSIHKAIKGELPIIGLIKKDYKDSDIYITPTLKEVKQLIGSKANIIALDATNRPRPQGETLKDLYAYIRLHSNAKVMADVSTVEEALAAEKLGFDYIATTLRGYTDETAHITIPDIAFAKEVFTQIKKSVIVAEGGIKTKSDFEGIANIGIKHIVIGSAITRPQSITQYYADLFEKRN